MNCSHSRGWEEFVLPNLISINRPFQSSTLRMQSQKPTSPCGSTSPCHWLQETEISGQRYLSWCIERRCRVNSTKSALSCSRPRVSNRTLIEQLLATIGRTFPSIRSFFPIRIVSTQMVWNKMFNYPIDSARRQFGIYGLIRLEIHRISYLVLPSLPKSAPLLISVWLSSSR
jgi:hypothetical protein